MITLEGDTLVLDRAQAGDDICTFVHPGKAGRETLWYIDILITEQAVMHWLIDVEVLDEDVHIRYIARNGQTAEGDLHIEELLSATEEGDQCRLRGIGKPSPVFLADAPQEV